MEDESEEQQWQKAEKKSEFWGWVKAIAIALILAFVVRTFVMTSFEVRGVSMVPTADDGERFIVNELS